MKIIDICEVNWRKCPYREEFFHDGGKYFKYILYKNTDCKNNYDELYN